MTINKPLSHKKVNQIYFTLLYFNLIPWGCLKAGSNLSHSESNGRCTVVFRTFGELPSGNFSLKRYLKPVNWESPTALRQNAVPL
jgi:hypothetical protein